MRKQTESVQLYADTNTVSAADDVTSKNDTSSKRSLEKESEIEREIEKMTLMRVEHDENDENSSMIMNDESVLERHSTRSRAHSHTEMSLSRKNEK